MGTSSPPLLKYQHGCICLCLQMHFSFCGGGCPFVISPRGQHNKKNERRFLCQF
nr:MAG TPA: hypothetical protein [Caudoviricetes sp.]